MVRRWSLPRTQHLRSLPPVPGGRHRRRVGEGRAHRCRRAPHEPRRRSRHVGPTRSRPPSHRIHRTVTDDARPMAPAFYAKASRTKRAWADWWGLLHPPYTLWHLSYVAIGATLAPRFDGGRLIATLVAFFLAVGVCAHALDELHGRPLRTAIPGWLLIGAATVSLAGAVAL